MANKMRNCPECGKIFVDSGAGICNQCIRKDEENEIIIDSYLRDNPGSTIKQIHEATGIKEKTIMRMIRSGRLGSGEVSYPCERCGTPISDGRYCDECTAALHNEIKKVSDSMSKKIQPVKPKVDNTGKKSRGMYSNK